MSDWVFRCATCGEIVCDKTALADARMLAAHATRHTARCEIVLEAAGEDVGGVVRLPAEFVCLHPGCDRKEERREFLVPPFLVGAAAIAFHAAHEGHPFRMTYLGVVIESPPPKG